MGSVEPRIGATMAVGTARSRRRRSAANLPWSELPVEVRVGAMILSTFCLDGVVSVSRFYMASALSAMVSLARLF